MSALASKPLTELRGMAQALGVKDIFQKEKHHLVRAIELHQQSCVVKERVEIPKPEYDARLMTKPPSKRMEVRELEVLLAPYVERGLKVRFSDEQWHFSHGKKNDEGTLRMPPRVVLKKAAEIME